MWIDVSKMGSVSTFFSLTLRSDRNIHRQKQKEI